ncbi:restriction endonuclease subunit S [Salmonella enterica subsp. enterica serovar Elomrane]|uniref:Restriction endonuclease subunit S n=1 Tax=Salmonella enterica TaxID=28901 RepID=A0A749T7U1_SALER|nr:restriction endonuclease subunit S [Salmonella enterica]EAA7368201.1 restriction endonuclease subunit S [Salmonella enterica subsp. enterica]ECJ6068713.1 restriction endonuclease subunit S [Salmonella enterica subsp. enterica serovar Cubana]EDN3609252.1 restriction endonuclease subunit S [Salmonella enterica subsp. enterica serovar Ouakam]QVB09835.1 restriction endonuclease subunit S [Salmonella enterica subsp. enterica serovar Javiana]AYB89945.1 restriction endonuclease subunit S [Salmonel
MSGGKLPEEWVKTTIGVICEVKGGKRLPKGKALLNTATEHPYIRVTDFENGSVNLSTIKYLDSDTYSAISNYTISKNDLYISIAGTIGLIGEIPEQLDNANLTENAAKLCFILGTDKKYLKHVLSSNKTIEQFDDKTTSSGQPKLALFRIRDCEFPYAPINEQKIIAEKLDTLLAQVDSTKARLEQIPQILKRFRQAVLAAATSGKLTEEWRSKNINAPIFSANSDCLKNFRNAELPVIPESWQWLRFDQIAEIASNLKSPLDYPNATHIAPNHIESWTGKVFGYQTIFEDGVTSAKHEFYKGQIIYSKIRPYLCKVAIATFDGLCSADMYPINSKIDTHFLFRWMLTTTFTDWASNAESRTVLPKINQKDLSEIPVPTPPLLEQHEIVRRVEQLFAYADTIEKQVNSALTRVNSLTQSILAKAFRGELTAQWRAENPSLISGENSAAALLEKIKAERAASGGKKTSRKKA